MVSCFPAWVNGTILPQKTPLFRLAQPDNAYAAIDEDGWHLSTDPAEKPTSDEEQRLHRLREWLGKNMRATRLPDLLIEVDNELHFTRHFARDGSDSQNVEEVCTILATVMAHGCNIGAYTMAKLTDGISYPQIKRVTDWQLSEENRRWRMSCVLSVRSGHHWRGVKASHQAATGNGSSSRRRCCSVPSVIG